MAAPIFLILFWVFTFSCSVFEVTHASPDIHYPFHIKGKQPQHDSHFELLQENTTTTIHFPSYGDLLVNSISYDTKNIYLADPKNCPHRVFMNLNLTLTPFQYYYVLKNYTYLNCSTKLSSPFIEIPCLSDSSYHVYTVDPALPVPGSCKGIKTVAIPFKYSPYLSDNSFGLRLTWDLHDSREEGNQTRDSHMTHYAVVGVIICVLVMVTLVSIKVHVSRRDFDKKERQLLLADF
ncbi:uncharacterized protein LOC130741035 [Lotus japonicus]|uniref:uncharacterized protein LOC130741035 n=1 Tax=Lotus japonicus TaxID=34305 RepID=UPI002590F000|nr:uncharacterized protein LOC130741035 [Lotus japonicus]